MSQLLREFYSLDYSKDKIKEAIEQKKPILLSGIFQKSDLKNANNRVYPKKILEREINNYQKIIKENRAVGTLDHEDSNVINLKNVSHVVRELSVKGNDCIGTLELLDTPHGQIAKSLLAGGIQIGISSRCLGDTEKSPEGYDIVKEDLLLLSFDIVQEPSTPNAWLQLKESKQVDYIEAFKSMPKKYRIERILYDILKK